MNRLSKYFGFNVPLFLKDIEHLKSEKKRLEEELEGVTYISALKMDGNSSHSSNITDTTAENALKIAKIKDEIKDVEDCLKVFDYGYKNLSNDEKFIIGQFFFSCKDKAKAVRECERHLSMSTAGVYRAKRNALEHFKELITED